MIDCDHGKSLEASLIVECERLGWRTCARCLSSVVVYPVLATTPQCVRKRASMASAHIAGRFPNPASSSARPLVDRRAKHREPRCRLVDVAAHPYTDRLVRAARRRLRREQGILPSCTRTTSHHQYQARRFDDLELDRPAAVVTAPDAPATV
jgi:hypothetical protein